jgi:hypothetical protein
LKQVCSELVEEALANNEHLFIRPSKLEGTVDESVIMVDVDRADQEVFKGMFNLRISVYSFFSV